MYPPHRSGKTKPIWTGIGVQAPGIGGVDLLHILAALGIIWFHIDGAPSRQRRNLLLSIVCGATLAGGAALTVLGFGGSAIPYGIGISLVCLAYGWQIKNHSWIAALAPLTLGIYFIHPVVLHGFRHPIAPQQNYAVFIALTAGISGLIALGLMRTPLRRFV